MFGIFNRNKIATKATLICSHELFLEKSRFEKVKIICSRVVFVKMPVSKKSKVVGSHAVFWKCQFQKSQKWLQPSSFCENVSFKKVKSDWQPWPFLENVSFKKVKSDCSRVVFVKMPFSKPWFYFISIFRCIQLMFMSSCTMFFISIDSSCSWAYSSFYELKIFSKYLATT